MDTNVQKVAAVFDDTGINYSNSNDKHIKVEIGGPSPTDLLLMAVAGCSGLTLRSLLERDGLVPEIMEVSVEGLKSEERPRKFTEIFIKYNIRCKDLTEEAMEKYLQITESVCPVIQSLSAKSHLDYVLNQ